MTTLKHLNLTERDFELIIDGLDQVPNKNQAGEMMGELMVAMLTKDEPESMSKIKAEREERQRKANKERVLVVEEIKILQGKLLMLKRYLIEQDALNQAQDIVNYLK